MEEWKSVGFHDYEISSEGRLRNKGFIIKGSHDKDGYLVHNLQFKGKVKAIKYHRLVATAFIPNPDNKPQVNHKDGVKMNCRKDNLEWCTGSENMKHSFDYLNRKNVSKIILQYTIDGIFIKEWESTIEIERQEGLDHSYISRACIGKCNTAYGYIWKHK